MCEVWQSMCERVAICCVTASWGDESGDILSTMYYANTLPQALIS